MRIRTNHLRASLLATATNLGAREKAVTLPSGPAPHAKPDSGWALVTGASAGIGKELALGLARAGWRLVLVGRSAERLEAVRKSLAGPRAEKAVALRSDLSEPGAAARLYAECASRGIEVEILVNNAGSGVFGPAVDSDSADVEAMISLNVTSLTGLSSLFGRDMKSRGGGRILNVGSFAGLNPTPYFASYAATKSYVLNYSIALRAELSGSGVVVTCLLPGYVRTEFDGNAGIANSAYLAFSNANSLDAATVSKIGLTALRRGGAWTIAGATNRLAAAFFAILPKTASPRIMKAALDRILASKGKA